MVNPNGLENDVETREEARIYRVGTLNLRHERGGCENHSCTALPEPHQHDMIHPFDERDKGLCSCPTQYRMR